MDSDFIKRMIEIHMIDPAAFEHEPHIPNTGITHEMMNDHRRAMVGSPEPSLIAQARAIGRETITPRQRFFIDTLSTTGDAYLIPAERRMDWDAYDTEAEATSDPPPIPDYAVALAAVSNIEFERPEEVFK